MSREAMQQALEALESDPTSLAWLINKKQAITVLRQALVDADDKSQERVDEKAKREQEPVAWISEGGDVSRSKRYMDEMGFKCNPLYTAPPKREWVGLTEEDMEALFLNEDGVRFARYIEAKLREKNT
jgi:hypothetical protein